MTFKKINILVVEDNQDHLYFIKIALKSERYNLKIITDGDEAYNYLLKPDMVPDVVLLDQFLPNMNGLNILKELKKKKKLYCVIFMSVDNAPETIEKALKRGAQNFITKEGDLAYILSDKIEDILKSNNQLA